MLQLSQSVKRTHPLIEHDETARLAEWMLTFRRIRPEELPTGLFGETGWEYLLELFVADARGIRMTGRDVCRNAPASSSAASRWLMYLTSEGLIVGDGDGDLDDELTLSGTGMQQIEQLLGRAQGLGPHILASG